MRSRRSTFFVSRFSFWGILILFLGCELDTDDSFYPVTQQQFLLTGDTTRHLLHIEQGELNEDWLDQQGWSAEISDMDAVGEVFWFASGPGRELFRWDGSQNIGQTFSLGTFEPHAVVIGNPYLLLIDSINQQLGFWDPESAEILIDMPWTHGVGESYYISGKFFVQKGDQHIEVFLENSLQPTAEITFEKDIHHIQVNASKSLHVLTRDSLVYEQTLSYFSYTPTLEPRLLIGFDDIHVSPYIRRQYGKEWLSSIWLRGQILFSRVPDFRIADTVQSYVVDFFEGKILYQRNDSLISYNLYERQGNYMAPLTQSIRKYRALRQPVGE